MDPESQEHLSSISRRGLVKWISGRYDGEDFDVDAKDMDTEAMEKWRSSALVLNAARRFRYTANLEKRVKVNV